MRAKRALLISAAGLLAFCGGFAAYPNHTSQLTIEEDSIYWNCHTDGNKICGPAYDSAEISRRAGISREMLMPRNAQYNGYLAGPNQLDAPKNLAEVHDELIEGCEGDWNDPFCDIVRHYQDLRINLGSSLGSEDRG